VTTPASFGWSVWAIRLPKSSICSGVKSGESSSFWKCGACSRRRSGWATKEFFCFLSFLSHALEIHARHSKK